MKSVVDGPVKDFQEPDGIVKVMIDKDTGLPATKTSTDVVEEAFIKGTEPKFQQFPSMSFPSP
jgi:membrane carboxypeptidase/penicillin-binding protein